MCGQYFVFREIYAGGVTDHMTQTIILCTSRMHVFYHIYISYMFLQGPLIDILLRLYLHTFNCRKLQSLE